MAGILALAGALVIVGTAGQSDLDPLMTTLQVDVQLIIGAMMLAGAGLLALRSRRA